MPHISLSSRSFLAALSLFPLSLAAATEIHVSPAGNDANPGTLAQPVATPQGAQVRVRTLIQAGLSDAVEVIFSAGTYDITAPLELRPEDSGTAAYPVTWRAETGAAVVLDGGKPISGPWINGGSGIWHTDLSGVGLGVGQWNFRQLFVDGSRATRARFPNASASNPFLYATGGALDHVIIAPAQIKASWGTAADAQINLVPQSRFFNQWNTVTGVNTGTGRIDIADSERHRTIDSGSWFWIEGVQAELDEPGEWFLHPTTGRLYYMPQPGVDPNTLSFVAPVLNRIVNVKGDVNAGTHVEHVHFDGLEFRHTTFTLGQIEARVHTDTVIMFENTSDSSVRNCHFDNIGGYALWLHLDSQRNVFDSNTVSHSGGGGVLMTGSRFAYMDDTKIYTPGQAAAKVAPILNEVTRNTVEHCGKIRYYGGGVHMDSRPFSMTMSPGNHIAHNHFNDLSRNGVFAFRNQGGNVVEYNHIHNCMMTTIDGAAIHFATMNTINAPNQILNNWLYDIWGFEQKPDGNPVRRLANGIFLDWDTSNTDVKDNWVYNSPVKIAVKKVFNDNRNLVISGNQYSDTPITPPFAAEVGPGGTAENGIILADNKLTGSIIHYTDSVHFSSSGTWTPETSSYNNNLFIFNFLTGTASAPSQATYTLPITEDGFYEISLLYKPASNRASNAPVSIAHADGTANVVWNMRQGNQNGFAVPVATYRFEAADVNTVTFFTAGSDGKVIADSVAFVKVPENRVPTAANAQIAGGAFDGGTLTGSFDYSDADNDPQGTSQFKWYRSDDAFFDEGDLAISGATSQSYTVGFADRGKYLIFEVTPVASSGEPVGEPVESASVLVSETAGFIHRLDSGVPQKIVLYGTSLTFGGAWVSQFQSAMQGAYPGLTTWVNSGGSGKASDWGVANLDTKVIAHNPDVVFIEFSMNDSAVTLNISREQAWINLTTMVNSIRTAHPDCEIVLQIMNPVDRRETDTFSPRPDLAQYQQDYRDFAALYGLMCIDHMPAFQALLDQGTVAYRQFVTDGVHPSAAGFSLYLTPVLLQAIGLGQEASAVPQLIVDNADAAPSMVFNGVWTASTANTGYHGADYVHNGNAGPGLKSAVFTPTIPGNATYPVYLRWTSGSNRASNVPVTVNFSGGSQVITVDQTQNGGKWVKLGDFPFTAGTSGNVTVGTTGTSGFVIVDALGIGEGAVGLPEVRLRMDNGRAAEPAFSGFAARPSSLIVWVDGTVSQPLEVFLDHSGGTASNGIDYGALPASVTIPAGKSWVKTVLVPLPDESSEVDETFHVSIVPNAAYDLGSPVEASIVIEDSSAAPAEPIFPIGWKYSNALSAQRLPANLSNANGMDPGGTFLYNLDGSPVGEPGSADGVCWGTSAKPNVAGVTAAAAAGKVWIVADLGASFDLSTIKIWNFNWDNTPGTPATSLNNRGVSQFDVLVRNTLADTSNGTPGGGGINPSNTSFDDTLDDDAVFNPGTSGQWQEVLSNQPLAQAPNEDTATGQSFSLPANTVARFVAIRVDAHHGGDSIGLGKVSFLGRGVVDDTAAPTLVSKNPAAGATNVPVASNLVATFVEAIQAGTGNITIKNLTDATQSSISITDGSQVTISGAVLSIHPSADLLAGKQYAIQIASTAVKDLAGNSYGGIADNTTWSFHTLASIPSGLVELVTENFNSSTSPLGGTSADTFAPAITSAGGSSIWGASGSFLQNGSVTGGNASAYLNLGNYIAATKGTAVGKFALTMTLSENTGAWISLGFAAENTPNTARNFTNTPTSGTGTGTTQGLGTIIYRAQNSGVVPGELDMFGSTNQNAVDGPNGNTGTRTLTVILDLTPAGGYDGTGNYGKVTWSDNVLGALGSFTYTTSWNFGAILISGTNTTGTISALKLSQYVPAPANDFSAWLAANAPATGFATDSDNDGIPNGVENILGSSPNSFNPGLTTVSSTASSMTFKHPLNPNIASNLTYGYEWSTNLTEWKSGGQTNTGGTSATITPSLPDGNGIVTVTITITGGPSKNLFGRLAAKQVP